MPHLLLYLWTLPTTAIGLPFLPLALITGGKAEIVQGVLEIHGGLITKLLKHCPFLKGGASAMTLGHVVLAQDAELAAITRSHERVHVRQAERWGPFFIPAYFAASLIAIAKGRNAYMDNAFEREAYEKAD